MMDVLVIEPGHGSTWLIDAQYVDRFGRENPRGHFVRGEAWYFSGAWNMPDDYRGEPETLTYPRSYILKVDEKIEAVENRVSETAALIAMQSAIMRAMNRP